MDLTCFCKTEPSCIGPNSGICLLEGEGTREEKVDVVEAGGRADDASLGRRDAGGKRLFEDVWEHPASVVSSGQKRITDRLTYFLRCSGLLALHNYWSWNKE